MPKLDLFSRKGVKIRNMSEKDNELSIGLCNFDHEVRSITLNGPPVAQRSIFHQYNSFKPKMTAINCVPSLSAGSFFLCILVKTEPSYTISRCHSQVGKRKDKKNLSACLENFTKTLLKLFSGTKLYSDTKNIFLGLFSVSCNVFSSKSFKSLIHLFN